MPAPCEGDAVADGVTWAGAVQSFMPALVGGVIGSGSTILAGYLGWNRERADRNESAQREAKVKAEEAREAHRDERATALLHGLVQVTTAMFEADSASARVQASDDGPAKDALREALREEIAKANIAVYRLLSLTRDEAVKTAIATTTIELAGQLPLIMDDANTQKIVRRLTDAVLAEHDALQPIASEPTD
jgi:hypothetical protein